MEDKITRTPSRCAPPKGERRGHVAAARTVPVPSSSNDAVRRDEPVIIPLHRREQTAAPTPTRKKEKQASIVPVTPSPSRPVAAAAALIPSPPPAPRHSDVIQVRIKQRHKRAKY